MAEYTLHFGDCLEYLETARAGDFRVVIADPPYSINTKSDGQGKINPWGDRVNAAFWYREWIGKCRSLMLGRGCLWSFLNWRSFATFQKVADDLGWPIESVLVWDKDWIGPGGHRGLRPSYEMVALWAGENWAIKDRGLADVQTFPWSAHKPNGHPAEKPVDLIRWLIEISTEPGDVVLDPFMGSGTTGVAAVQSGRGFIGCEVDPHHFAQSEKRIREAAAQPPLFTDAPREPQPEQGALFE